MNLGKASRIFPKKAQGRKNLKIRAKINEQKPKINVSDYHF